MNACPICRRPASDAQAWERTRDGYCKGATTIECDFIAKVRLGYPVGLARRDRAAAYRALNEKRAA